MNNYNRHLNLPFSEAVEAVRKALTQEGFAVVTTFDLAQALEDRVGCRPYTNYLILGACNAPLAEKAVQIDPSMGVFLPCNILLYEDERGTHLSISNPLEFFERAERDEIRELATEADARLRRVVNALH